LEHALVSKGAAQHLSLQPLQGCSQMRKPELIEAIRRKS
jgi:hypothetical protein